MKDALLITFMASVGKKAMVILLGLLIEGPNLEKDLKVEESQELSVIGLDMGKTKCTLPLVPDRQMAVGGVRPGTVGMKPERGPSTPGPGFHGLTLPPSQTVHNESWRRQATAGVMHRDWSPLKQPAFSKDPRRYLLSLLSLKYL